MRFSIAALVLASAGYAAAASCPDQTVIDACISSTKAALSQCQDHDYDCVCTAWTGVVACYNNCPNDVDLATAQTQQAGACAQASHPKSDKVAATTPVIGAISSSVSSSLASVSSSIHSEISSLSSSIKSETSAGVSSATSAASAAISSLSSSLSSVRSTATASASTTGSGSATGASATSSSSSSSSTGAAPTMAAGGVLALVGAGLALAL